MEKKKGKELDLEIFEFIEFLFRFRTVIATFDVFHVFLATG